MKKPAIYQIEQPAPNVTAIARMPNTELPVKHVSFRTCGYGGPVAPTKLFAKTSGSNTQPPMSPLNRR